MDLYLKTSNMSEIHKYDVDLEWNSHRKGSLSSPELSSEIEVATPPEFPGGMPDIWSPEHLLVAAVNSCLMTTFLAIAENSNLEFISFKSRATGILGKIDGKFQVTDITLRPLLRIPAFTNAERAKRIIKKSEQHCLISNSIKSVIHLEAEVIVEETKQEQV